MMIIKRYEQHRYKTEKKPKQAEAINSGHAHEWGRKWGTQQKRGVVAEDLLIRKQAFLLVLGVHCGQVCEFAHYNSTVHIISCAGIRDIERTPE